MACWVLACGRRSSGYKRCSGWWGRDGPSLVDSSLSLAAYLKFTFDTSALNQCLHKLTVIQRITENLFTPGNITKNLSTPGNICKDFQYTLWGCPVLQELPLSVSKSRIKCHHHLSMYKNVTCNTLWMLPVILELHGRQHGGIWVVSYMPFPGILKTFVPSQVIGPRTALVSEAFLVVAKGL